MRTFVESFRHRREIAKRSRDPFRVFCIGFNKTGTSSLHRFFQCQGLVSTHDTEWTHASWISDGKSYFDRADCFCDGGSSKFVALEAWFPEALFVLNTRDERAWLRSRVKHVFRFESDDHRDRPRKKLKNMAEDFLNAPEIAIDNWITTKRLYEARVRAHFRDSTRFLEVRVTEDVAWQDKLVQMLERCGRTARPGDETDRIHANRRSAFSNFPQIESYLAVVDARLTAMGPDPLSGAED